MKCITFLIVALLIVLSSETYAGSATWNQNPIDNLWNRAGNWTPATVPNDENDIATFGFSNISEVIVGESADFGNLENPVGAIVFTPDANAYTIRSAASHLPDYYFDIIEFYGAGIVNNSGKAQNVIVEAAPGPEEQQAAVMYFQNSSSVGDNVIITNQGSGSNIGIGAYGGYTHFGYEVTDRPNAGNATIINEGGKVSGSYGGGTALLYAATADSATFINQPGEVDGAYAGRTFLDTYGKIGRSTFLNKAASVTGAEGGWTELDRSIGEGAKFIAYGATSAGPQGGQVYTYGGSGYASFVAKGGKGSGAEGGLVYIQNICDSEQTVVNAEAGKEGGQGGMITVTGAPVTLDQVQFRLQGNATLAIDILVEVHHSVTIGSLSGKGTVTLGRNQLAIGNNDLDTVFSGVVQDEGRLSKVGSGSLTLTGANIYTRGTSVNSGILVVANKTGSATGTGPVTVTSGTLSGSGVISGPVTVGTGSGAGAFLAPAAGTNKPSTLTIQKSLTFNSDATYTYTFQAKRNKVRSDEVIANGVTINNATLNLSGTIQGRMQPGAVLTLISNTKANPISGSFSNLADGAIVSVNGNNLQASYSGGDGNDLVLTLVQ